MLRPASNEMRAADADMLRSLVAYFPDQPVWASSSLCIVQYAWWWVLYYENIRPVADGWYRVEHTSPCQVARLGGFIGASSVSPAAASLVEKACHASKRIIEQRKPSPETAHGELNRHNRDGFVLSWSTLERVGGADLTKRLRKLAREFGYISKGS